MVASEFGDQALEAGVLLGVSRVRVTTRVAHRAHPGLALGAAEQREHRIPPEPHETLAAGEAKGRPLGEIQPRQWSDARIEVVRLALGPHGAVHAADARRAPEEMAVPRWRGIVVEMPDEAAELPLVGLDAREVVDGACLDAEGDPLQRAGQRDLERDTMRLRLAHRRPVEVVVLIAARLERHLRAELFLAVVAEPEVRERR